MRHFRSMRSVLPAMRRCGLGRLHGTAVAILARDAEPVESRRRLPGDPADTQSRYLEAAVNGMIVGCLYLPNGNPQPGPKFDYKLAWFERLIAHAAELFSSGHPVVLAGDFNVIPTDFDIYNTRSWLKDALLQPESRACYERLLAQGWTDAIRHLHPNERIYTFWGLLPPALADQLRPAHRSSAAEQVIGGKDSGPPESMPGCAVRKVQAIMRRRGSLWTRQQRGPQTRRQPERR